MHEHGQAKSSFMPDSRVRVGTVEARVLAVVAEGVIELGATQRRRHDAYPPATQTSETAVARQTRCGTVKRVGT